MNEQMHSLKKKKKNHHCSLFAPHIRAVVQFWIKMHTDVLLFFFNTEGTSEIFLVLIEFFFFLKAVNVDC